MADEKSRIDIDRTQIGLNEVHEVRDWIKSFGCSEQQIREAAKAVGSSEEVVCQWLSSP